MSDKRIAVSCPSCQTINELERGFFRWKKTECVKCGETLTFENAGAQAVVCDKCRKTVIYDAARKNDCPNCGSTLNIQRERQAIGCPNCTMPVYWLVGDTEATCLNCGETFDPEKERGVQEGIVSNDAPDIRMPGTIGSDELFWRHPMERLPLNARIIAKPGMSVLCMQGDELALAVDGRSAQLSESGLVNDAWQYDGASGKMVDVSIFYVRNAFSATFRWGGVSAVSDRYNQVSQFSYTGTCEIDRVTDPAKFMRYIEFDPNVHVSDFRMHRSEQGVETPGRCAANIRDVIKSVCQGALQKVRDDLMLMASEMVDHRQEIFDEIQRQANLELDKWGLSIRGLSGELRPAGTAPRQDPLAKRLSGALSWQTRPFTVHLKDAEQATASLQVAGSMYVTVQDRVRLESCPEVPAWCDPNRREDAARTEIADHVGRQLVGRFAADIQQLIDEMSPSLALLQSYSGYLTTQAQQLLNQAGGFFAVRGLFAGDLTIEIRVIEKSEAYARREKYVSFEDELYFREKIEQRQREAERRRYIEDTETDTIRHETDVEAQKRRVRSDMGLDDTLTDQYEQQMRNRARREAAAANIAHDAALRSLKHQEEEDAFRRRISYAQWKAEQEQQEEAMEREMAAARRRQQQAMENERANAIHEKDLYEIAQEIEASKLTWREKLDAYARLQRGLAFQDQLDQETARSKARAENEDYAARLSMNLNAEKRRVMEALDHEERLREEELAKARFAREMEKHRQEVAEKMEQLHAEYEQERAREQERERIRQQQQEIETMRLMFDYLLKTGEQQVTQASLKAAREDAERSWQREHEEVERRQAEALRREQAANEQRMADRAQELVEKMLVMKDELEKVKLYNERDYHQGRAMVDSANARYQEGEIAKLLEKMKKLQAEVKTLEKKTAAPAEDAGLDKWFQELMARTANLFSGASAQPQYPGNGYASVPQPAAQNTRTCGRCGQQFSISAFMCPNCRWRP